MNAAVLCPLSLLLPERWNSPVEHGIRLNGRLYLFHALELGLPLIEHVSQLERAHRGPGPLFRQ